MCIFALVVVRGKSEIMNSYSKSTSLQNKCDPALIVFLIVKKLIEKFF